MASEYFDAREVARLSGLTFVMLDYLCRTGVVVPTGESRPGRGRPRLYTFGDVVIVRALRHLLDAGVSVSRLKRALAGARRHFGGITPSKLPGKYLVASPKGVYFKTNRADVLEELNGQRVFAFVIELERVRDDVASEAGLRSA